MGGNKFPPDIFPPTGQPAPKGSPREFAPPPVNLKPRHPPLPWGWVSPKGNQPQMAKNFGPFFLIPLANRALKDPGGCHPLTANPKNFPRQGNQQFRNPVPPPGAKLAFNPGTGPSRGPPKDMIPQHPKESPEDQSPRGDQRIETSTRGTATGRKRRDPPMPENGTPLYIHEKSRVRESPVKGALTRGTPPDPGHVFRAPLE